MSKRIFKPRAGRSPVRLSKVTNQLKIDGTDGRSSQNRRLRDIVSGLAADMGGWDSMPETARTLARQAATLAIQIEQLQAKMITAAPTVGQGEVLSRLVNLQRRTMAELKAAAPKPKKPDLGAYLASRR